jgi:phosphoribosylformylglycinamidine cyclo-ligase
MKGTTYKDSGVDIGKADRLISTLKGRIERTFDGHVLSSIGGFASLTEIPDGYRHPVLVSSTDGVGTKLRIAFMAGKHDTVGIDLVAMSVNDVLTVGAKPINFLDYYASGKIDEVIYHDVLSGICTGCELAGCALVGGETAEMPSFYDEGEYELAGFVSAIVEKDRIINGSAIGCGDRIVGIASTGIHSNGFSLVRNILFDMQHLGVADHVEGLGDQPLHEELLKPTRIYVKPVLALLDAFTVKGMAHITVGGLPGNVSRIIPQGLRANIVMQPERIPKIFNVLQELGNVPLDDMYSTFNMGVGFVLIVKADEEEAVIERLLGLGEEAFSLGSIEETSGEQRVSVSALR